MTGPVRAATVALSLALGLVGCDRGPAPAAEAPPAPAAAKPPPKRVVLGPSTGPTPGVPTSGRPAPDLSLPDLESGEVWTLSDQLDPSGESCPRGFLIAFMASWCGYCHQSLPTLVELERDFPDLAVVTVTVDSDDASRQKELKKVRDAGLKGPVLAADEAAIATWTAGGAVPKYFFIDHNGVLAAKDEGFGDNVKPMMPAQAKRALRD